MTNIRHWLVMTILCLSSGIIFLLPFLREVYYIPMQEAFGYNNTQLGIQMSVFGAASLLSYFPGGWIADRYSARKLITGASIAVGLGGFYFSTSPSYEMGILLHAYWGAAISLAFWGAMIKTTRNWAPAEEQGRAFGILEGGRGLSEVITSTAFLAVFAWLGSEVDGLMRVIQLFAVTNILLGVAAWFILEDDEHSAQDVVKKVAMAEVKTVLKMPAVWLISLVVMAAYSAYWGTFYFTPYATDALGLSVVIGGAIGVGKGWLKPLAAIGAGFLADKIGVATSVFGCFLILIFGFTFIIWKHFIQELEKNKEGRMELEDEDDLFKTVISPFCAEIFYCYYGDEDADADDIKEWEIVEDLEENVQSAKFRIPAFMKLVFKWEQEDLERTITLPIKRISPNGIKEEPL